MLTSIIAFVSLMISLLSLINSVSAKNYQKKKDDKLLKPQLFLKSEKKPIIDYIGIGYGLDDSYKIFKEYNDISMTFTNITDNKIFDLFILIDVKRNNSFYFLMNKALEEERYIYFEKDIYDNEAYSWEKIFGLLEKEEKKVDVLNGGESFEIKLPGIYVALLMGAMYSHREKRSQLNFEIEFDLEIFYRHVFSETYLKIEETFIVNITYKDAIQGPEIVYDSINFNQL